MPQLQFDQKTLFLNEDESVLEGLLRHGEAIPHGCRAGACQSCLMRADAGELPAAAQVGLKASQKELGYFLSCCCRPHTDLQVSIVDQGRLRVPARVLSVTLLNADVLRVRLSPAVDFKPGQYINIWHTPDSVRSYSIASLPSDNYLELHIRVFPDGAFSRWAFDHLHAGDTLQIQGPLGYCIYTAEQRASPLLLAAVGTGLAPLYGIARNALQQNHLGPISLFVGARNASDFYLLEALLTLAEHHPQFTVQFVALQNPLSLPHCITADIYQTVKAAHPDTQNYQIYLCGSESFVHKMKKQCFLAGAPMHAIHSDVFLPCGG